MIFVDGGARLVFFMMGQPIVTKQQQKMLSRGQQQTTRFVTLYEQGTTQTVFFIAFSWAGAKQIIRFITLA